MCPAPTFMVFLGAGATLGEATLAAEGRWFAEGLASAVVEVTLGACTQCDMLGHIFCSGIFLETCCKGQQGDALVLAQSVASFDGLPQSPCASAPSLASLARWVLQGLLPLPLRMLPLPQLSCHCPAEPCQARLPQAHWWVLGWRQAHQPRRPQRQQPQLLGALS
jgi:hypothetical protein